MRNTPRDIRPSRLALRAQQAGNIVKGHNITNDPSFNHLADDTRPQNQMAVLPLKNNLFFAKAAFFLIGDRKQAFELRNNITQFLANQIRIFFSKQLARGCIWQSNLTIPAKTNNT